MRPHYFDREAADIDDNILTAMIEAGHVPKTCLWGGSMVQSVVAIGDDPCAYCTGPRERCKGRPQREETNQDLMTPDTRGVTMDDAGARKLLRLQHKKQLLAWMDEAEQEKKR